MIKTPAECPVLESGCSKLYFFSEIKNQFAFSEFYNIDLGGLLIKGEQENSLFAHVKLFEVKAINEFCSGKPSGKIKYF